MMAPVGVRERPDRALVVLILSIEFPFDHLPKIVDRSFVSVVDNYCILVWTYCFSSSLSGGTQDSSPILQGSAKPAGFAFFFSDPCSRIFGVFLFACYFNMKKSQDVSLSSLNLRMSYSSEFRCYSTIFLYF